MIIPGGSSEGTLGDMAWATNSSGTAASLETDLTRHDVGSMEKSPRTADAKVPMDATWNDDASCNMILEMDFTRLKRPLPMTICGSDSGCEFLHLKKPRISTELPLTIAFLGH